MKKFHHFNSISVKLQVIYEKPKMICEMILKNIFSKFSRYYNFQENFNESFKRNLIME